MKKTIEQLKALGEPNRFRIMMMLHERSLCVCEIQSILNISGSTLYNHLKTLKYAGLTDQRRDGKWIEYFVKDDSVTKLLDQITEHLVDPEQIESDKEHVRTSDRNICSLKK